MRVWLKWSAWLSLSLMLWTAAAESTHTHPNPTDSLSCSICLFAHSASPAVISASNAPTFAAVGLLRQEDVVAKAQIEVAYAGIRGPPVL